MSSIKNAIFVASAGTGKTHQVTSLYRSLLLGELFPAEDSGIISAKPIFDGKEAVNCADILMLTFARNAASEMRSRITEQIEAEIAENPYDINLMNILRSLSAANIATIHSFAQRLLRENAVEAAISPSAGLIEDDEMQEMLNAAIEKMILRTLEEGEEQNKFWMQIYRARKADDFIKVTRDFVSSLQSRGIDLSSSDDQAIQDLAPKPLPPSASDLLAVSSLIEPAASSDCKLAAALSDEIQRIAASLEEVAAPAKVLAAAKVLHSDFIFNKRWGDFKPLRDEAGKMLQSICGYEEYLLARECLISLLDFTKRCVMQFDSDKKERGVLDYSDLLAKAVELVEGHGAAVPPFKVIIVDEAQDNSKVQNRLIEGIRAATGASVILCGDSKQTIHTWRGAEYGGMDTMADTLKDLQSIPLFRSFRSQRGILDWVNGISSSEDMFAALYDKDHQLAPNSKSEDTEGPSIELLLPEWEFGEDPDEKVLVPTAKGEPKGKSRFCLTGSDIKKLAEDEVEDSNVWQDAHESYKSRLAQEARALAKRIKLLCTDESDRAWKPQYVFDKETASWIETPTPDYHYKDILILLRASTNQPVYEAALREQDIPYSSGGRGKGFFFFRQEVRDIISLIAWLAFERDGGSLMAVARSPFVTLSDPAIAALSHAGGSERLTGKVFRKTLIATEPEAHENESRLRDMGLHEDADAYLRAWALLGHLRGLAGRVSVVDLVREAIKQSGFDAILAGSFHGAQKLANMRKMLSFVQDLERRNNLDLQSVASHLKEYAGQKEEADAIMLDPSDDSVKFCTVHSAKGLTSPVVIIPDLSRTPRSGSDWLSVYSPDIDKQAIAGKFRIVTDEEPEHEICTSEYDNIKVTQDERRREESERLFYVAQTRPRDLLILSGSSPDSDGAWRSWINKYLLGLNEKARSSQIKLIPYPEVYRAADVMIAPVSKTMDRGVTLFAQAAAAVGQLELPMRTRMSVTTLVKVPDGDDEKSTLEYRQSALVGLAPAWARAKEDVSEDSIDYAARGTIAHSILENLDFGLGATIQDQVEDQLSTVADDSMDESLRRGLIAAGEYLHEELSGAEHIIREFPFCTKFEHDTSECLVDGKIDLIYLKDGIWHVVDYKFSSAGKSDLLKDYSLQLLVYRKAISRETGELNREILLGEAETMSPVCMRIMGISKDGKLTVADVDGSQTDSDVARRIVEAAKLYYTSLK